MTTEPPVPRHQVGSTLKDQAIRAIAVFEGIKGLAALASAIGLLSMLHHDLHRLTLELVGHFGLDPAQHYPALLLHYVDVLNATPVRTVVLLTAGYVSLRLVEAYGLWYERPWGEVLGALSSGIYIPFELRHLYHQPGAISVVVVFLNTLIVLLLVLQLRSQRVAMANSRR